jgi:hypothetical protein
MAAKDSIRGMHFVVPSDADYVALANRLGPSIPLKDQLLLSKAKPILWKALRQTRGHVVANTIATENLVRQENSSGNMETVIEIRCGDEVYCEHIENMLKKRAIRKQLKDCKCPLIPPTPKVVFDPTLKGKKKDRPFQGPDPGPSSGVDVNHSHPASPVDTSAMGLASSAINGDGVMISTGKTRVTVSIGGVVLVGESLFGLAAGHTLPPDMSPKDISIQGTQNSQLMSIDTKQYDVESDTDDEHQLEGSDTISFLENAQSEARSNRLLIGQFLESGYRFGMAEDWALIKLSTPFVPVNELVFTSSKGKNSGTIPIDHILREHQFSAMLAEVGNRDGGRLRCVISTADGMVPALVEPGIRTLIMNGATFEVLRVVAGDTISRFFVLCSLSLHLLTDGAEEGTSGSWVIVDGALLGTVIAGHEDTNADGVGIGYAFVLPIEKTFQDIAAFMRDNVRLPTRIDNDIMIIQQRKEQSKWLIPSATLEAPSYHGTGNDLSYELLIAQRQALRRSGGTIPWFSGRYEDEVTETSPFAKDLGALVHVEHRRGTRAKLYEQLTKLRYETIERVMVLGQAFPLSPFFRVPMTSWVHRNKVSRVHGRRGFAALMLLEDCSTTEAGENFLGLFFALRKFSMQRKDILGREKQRAGDDDWLIMVFSALFQAMNIPPASRPSAPQLRLFVDLCMSGFTDFRMNGVLEEEDEWIRKGSPRKFAYESASFTKGSGSDPAFTFNSDDLTDARHMAKLLLSISETAHVCSQDIGITKVAGSLVEDVDPIRTTRGGTALVCSGSPWAEWAGGFAESVLGLTVEWRLYVDGQYSRDSMRKAADQAGHPMLYVFIGTDSVVCEFVPREELPPPPLVSGRSKTVLSRLQKSRFRRYLKSKDERAERWPRRKEDEIFSMV